MRCAKCNRELGETSGECEFCRREADENVRILTPEEKSGYQGVTIETNHQGQDRESAGSNRSNSNFYIRKIRLGRSNWLTRLAVYVVLAAVAAFILFVIFPMALMAVGIGIIVWIVLNFMKR